MDGEVPGWAGIRILIANKTTANQSEGQEHLLANRTSAMEGST
jgi:hypothetical protein